MKQFIILTSTILLGVAIFNMIMGDDSNSIFNVVKDVWYYEAELRTKSP